MLMHVWVSSNKSNSSLFQVDWKDLDDRKIQPPWIPPDIQQPNKKCVVTNIHIYCNLCFRNFVDWPGVELPTKVTQQVKYVYVSTIPPWFCQQENSYCLSLDVPSCGRAAGWLPRQRSSSMITPSSRYCMIARQHPLGDEYVIQAWVRERQVS